MCYFSSASHFLGNAELLLLHLSRMHHHRLCRGRAGGTSYLCLRTVSHLKSLPVRFWTVQCSLAKSIFRLQGFALPQPLWSLESLVYFVSLSAGRMQCNAGSCWWPAALPFLVGIVPQNQVPQSPGVTWPGCSTPVRSLPWESCPVFVWPSQSSEPALTFQPFLAALPHRGRAPHLQLWALQVLAKSQPPPAPSQKLLGPPHFLQSPALLQQNASSTSAASSWFLLPKELGWAHPLAESWQWCMQRRMQELQPHTAGGGTLWVCPAVVLWSLKPLLWSFMGPFALHCGVMVPLLHNF